MTFSLSKIVGAIRATTGLSETPPDKDSAGFRLPAARETHALSKSGLSGVGSDRFPTLVPAASGQDRGWLEDQLLSLLGTRLLPGAPTKALEHAALLQSILLLLGDAATPVDSRVLRVLEDAVAGYELVLQGRTALREV